MLDRSVVEDDVFFEIAHFDPARGSHLHRQFMRGERAAVAVHREMRRPLGFRRAQRYVAALGQPQQIVGGPVAGDDLSLRIVRDPHCGRDCVEHCLELRGALALFALAFHERTLDSLAFGDVVRDHDHAHDLPAFEDR